MELEEGCRIFFFLNDRELTRGDEDDLTVDDGEL